MSTTPAADRPTVRQIVIAEVAKSLRIRPGQVKPSKTAVKNVGALMDYMIIHLMTQHGYVLEGAGNFPENPSLEDVIIILEGLAQ